MKKVMTIIGLMCMVPIVLIESLIKIIWGIVYYTFRPLWRNCFSTRSIKKMEKYTKFKHEYIILPKIIELWEDWY